MNRKRNRLWVFALLATALFFALPAKAQVTIGDNQTPPHSFSLLELTASKVKGGLRLPQLTNAERNALNLAPGDNEAKGLLIFNTDAKCFQYWNGTKWVSFSISLN
jgi:hypothetical protein